MSAARASTIVASLALLAAPARAQDAAPGGWLGRLGVSAHYAALDPAGRSDAFALIDRALAPSALRPRLAGAELHVRVARRWSALVGAEAGGSTVASVSRVRPAAATDDVRQRTSLELAAVRYLGAEWHALRWVGADANATDRLRVVLGAGGGVARYRLRQWGDFVDAERGVAFADDFRSAGRGAFGYASAGVDVPLRRWVALRGTVRRQVGSAPMSGDFATFDRLDLGGTRIAAGVVLARR